MTPVEEERWAAAHYRVERESTGRKMGRVRRRYAAAAAVAGGVDPPGPSNDVVRIFDRVGSVVFEKRWGGNRKRAIAQERQIVDDLLHLDVDAFRAKYGIAGAPLAGDAPPAAGAPPAGETPPPGGTP